MKWHIVFLCYICMIQMLYADIEVRNIELKQKGETLEIFLNLSSVYEKSPYLTQQDGYKGVIFPNLGAKAYNESFKNFFITQVQIFNIQESLYILGVGDTRFIDVNVSKTPHILKIVFQRVTPPPSEIDKLLQTSYSSQIPNINIIQQPITPTPPILDIKTDSLMNILPFKNDLGLDTWRYVAVLGVMAFLVLILWIVKRYVVHKKQFSSYFDTLAYKKDVFDPTKIEVISQKHIDSKNRILTIHSNGYRYLILIGATSTTLIDRYLIPQNITHEEKSRFDDQFAKLLEQKQERLSKYLHNKSDKL